MTTAGRPERPPQRRAGRTSAPDPAVAEPTPSLFKAVPAPPHERPRAAGPTWVVVPARIVALVVVVPLRLLYEGVRAVLHGLWAAIAWVFGLLWRVLAAIGRGLYAAVLRPLVRLLVLLLVRPALWIYAVLLTPVGRALWWVLERVIVRPAIVVGRVLAWLVNVLIVTPAVLLWRYVLRPPLAGLVWLLRWVGEALVWAWRTSGRVLAWLGRVFIVIPGRAVWRYALRPVWLGVAASWRLGVRPLWRHLVVAPSRWVRRNVLSPIRQAGRDIRLTIRRAFRGV